MLLVFKNSGIVWPWSLLMYALVAAAGHFWRLLLQTDSQDPAFVVTGAYFGAKRTSLLANVKDYTMLPTKVDSRSPLSSS